MVQDLLNNRHIDAGTKGAEVLCRLRVLIIISSKMLFRNGLFHVSGKISPLNALNELRPTLVFVEHN